MIILWGLFIIIIIKDIFVNKGVKIICIKVKN